MLDLVADVAVHIRSHFHGVLAAHFLFRCLRIDDEAGVLHAHAAMRHPGVAGHLDDKFVFDTAEGLFVLDELFEQFVVARLVFEIEDAEIAA